MSKTADMPRAHPPFTPDARSMPTASSPHTRHALSSVAAGARLMTMHRQGEHCCHYD